MLTALLLTPLACFTEAPECSDEPAALSLPAEVIDFGEVIAGGQSATAVLQVGNDGGQRLALGEAELSSYEDGDASAFTLVDASPRTLYCGEETTLTIRFEPDEVGEYTALLRMTTSDPAQPTVEVPIRGVGSDPRIRVDPSSVWAPAEVGTLVTNPVTIESVGLGALEVYGVWLDAPEAEEVFSLVTPEVLAAASEAAPLVLPEGDSVSFEVRFEPDGEGEWDEVLLIRSNDPYTPTTYVRLLGTTADCSGAPSVSITSPADGAVVAGDAPVLLTASVSDDCDAPQSMTTIWYATTADGGRVYLNNSAIDEDGDSTVEVTLPEGEVIVEAQTSDSWGLTGSDTVTLTVE